jgi:hypothetical protein
MKVTARTIQNLTIPSNPSIVSGNQFQFSTIATYSDGFSKDVTEDTIWTIDNPNVAILADNTNRLGQVVGVDSGTAKLTATFVGVPPLTVTVTVLP